MTAGIERIICFASGKGGVGKSVLSSISALILSSKGKRVGLLDLDFHGPSVLTVLGAQIELKEERGIVPPEFCGVKIMSIIPFAGNMPVVWRGKDVSEAILELLAVVRWGELDFLVVDMPPGTGEEILESSRLLGREEFIVVTTPSRLSIATVGRLISALKELRAKILGVVENMGDGAEGRKLSEISGIRYLGRVRYDGGLEEAIGNPEKLLKTRVAQDLQEILEELGS